MIGDTKRKKAEMFFQSLGYVTERLKEHVCFDLRCRGEFDNIWVQVYSTLERASLVDEFLVAQDLDYGHKAHFEIVKYNRNQKSIVPINRIIYPNKLY